MVFWNAIRTSGPSKGVEWNEIVFDRQKIAFSMRDYGKKPVLNSLFFLIFVLFFVFLFRWF